MKDMWDKATRIIKTKSETNLVNNSTSLVGVWWGLWILSNYIGKYVAKSAFKADTLDTLTNSTMAEIITSTIDIPLAIITVMMIKQYADKEAELYKLEQREHALTIAK